MQKASKVLKDGILYLKNGFEHTILKPLSALVGVSDTQILTNKTIDGNNNTLLNVPETTIGIAITEENENFLVDENGLTLIQFE